MRTGPDIPVRTTARSRQRRPARCAFTIVELVLVIAIIGVLSSIVLPRLDGRAAAAGEAAVHADLKIVREAIDRYAAEHHGVFPGLSAARTTSQLTQYTNASGQISATKRDDYVYGPYLRAIPANPIWTKPGADQIYIDLVNSPPQAQLKADAGWVYNPNTGEFYANSTELMQHGVKLIENPGAVAAAVDLPDLKVEDLLAEEP